MQEHFILLNCKRNRGRIKVLQGCLTGGHKAVTAVMVLVKTNGWPVTHSEMPGFLPPNMADVVPAPAVPITSSLARVGLLVPMPTFWVIAVPGALAVNGNTGNAGQVLKSNGSSNAASWVSYAMPQLFPQHH